MEKTYIPRKLMTERKWYSSSAHFKTEANYTQYKAAHKKIYGSAKPKKTQHHTRKKTGLSLF